MDRFAIEKILDDAEKALAEAGTVTGSGFWKAVAAIKANPELNGEFADRVGRIDLAAFRQWAFFAVPLWIGTFLMAGATAVGLLLVARSYQMTDFGGAVVFLLGLGMLLVTTHGLAHLVVGRTFGIRFTHWFIGTLTRPQPGVKTDYSSYLRTPARQRAWMHASGAIVTKLIPFLVVGAAIAADLPGWVVAVTLGVGVITIIIDVVWSTKASDWKKFKREMSFVHDS